MKFNDLLLKALSKEKCSRPPIWLMRQAGRYMSEYRTIRNRVSFLELCKSPELACEVTLQPVDLLGVDAAILFSDILVPVEPMGIRLGFNPAPMIFNPVRAKKSVESLTVGDPVADLPFIYKTIRLLIKKLKVPLIGFAGAPFTLACYLTEGEASKSFVQIKKLMHNQPTVYNALMDKLTEYTLRYLQNQINSGCSVVQIFDTWAGILTPTEYREKALPWVKALIASLSGAQVIYFAKDSFPYFDDLKTLCCSGLGLDWKVGIDEANNLLGGKFCLQGNLDPAMLFTNKRSIKKFAADIINRGNTAPGHIFNLGHGIMLGTPVNNVKFLVDFVRGEI